MKKMAFASAILLLFTCGCSKQDKVKLEPADIYSEDAVIYNYMLDTTNYEGAIEDIIYYDGWEPEQVEAVIEQHKDVLSDSFIVEFRSRAVELPDSDVVDDMDNEELDALIGQETTDTSEWDAHFGEQDTQTEGYDENGEYVGLGENPDIGDGEDDSGLDVDNSGAEEYGGLSLTNIKDGLFDTAYATDEDQYSDFDLDGEYHIEPAEDEGKVYEVVGIDAYPDKLVASVMYKYGAPMKVLVALENEKILGYRIFR